MIRRSVRKAFRNVYWAPPQLPPPPCIFVPNHHGWHDGYVMYHAVTKLGLRSLDWIAEFDAFPLFAAVGGLPFPPRDASRRAATIRKTLNLMRAERRSLILFAEGTLHRPSTLMPFGKALELLADKALEAAVVPVGIRYEMAMHERPECHLMFGAPVERGPNLAYRTKLEVAHLLDLLEKKVRFEPEVFEVLASGTPDVNERLDMRRIPRFRK